ncbi:MAG: restriction endonuclease [Verrucomicrobia subdivision 3 bacterium]|nr:restriction endonuclease [Limisphaerales bacterium]
MFGAFVKSLRERQRLGLRRFCLAHNLDPSNWSKIEREILPPPKDEKTLQSWAKYLGLAEASQEWNAFFDFAAQEQQATPPVQQLLHRGHASILVPPPPATRPEKLPLGDPSFSWTQFEAFSRDLVSQLDKVVECTHYGTQGSKQRGIDLFARLQNGKRWAFQCKQVRKFTVGDLKKAIAKTTYHAAKYVILASCEVGSEVRDILMKQPKWDLWDVRDISRKVRGLDADKARALVERHFGQDWRKLFLGLDPLSPFLSPAKYFERLLQPERLFNHSWTLVGRLDILTELENFAHSGERVAILAGRGGIGKSKLLEAFSTGPSRTASERIIWFVQEEVPLTPEAFGELPLRPILLIVDDAHRRDDIGLLLAHANRRSDVKLLFSSRPQGIEVLQSLLSQSGFDMTEMRLLPQLKQLDRPNVTALARQALGPEHSHLAEQLADVTRDCPLVTVVGGKLLAQRAIHPALLERNDDFRFAVLNRFRDEMLGKIGQENAAFYRALLELISATAPVYADDKKYPELAAAYLEKSLDVKDRHESTPENVMRAVGQLEKAGLLLRRGRSLRITPDVLADHVLANLCVAPNGVPTGAAEKLFDHFLEHSPERVLRNLAEVDWRIERTSGKGIDLLAKIWNKLDQDFLTGTSHARLRLLEIVKEAAYFQPGRALRYARLAYEALLRPAKPEPVEIFPLSNESLIAELPEILQHAAYSMDYLQDCCEMLWRLGRSDSRPLNPFPHHAIRVLQSLAAYQPNKPLAFNEIVLDCIDSWLQDAGAFDFVHSPLSIIDELLEKSADASKSEGGMLVVTAFLIDPQKTRKVRSRTIQILKRSAKSAKPRVVVAILETLGSVLHDRFKMGAAPNSPEYLRGWLPEKLDALGCIEEIVAGAASPLVHWKAIQILEWPSAESPQPEVRKKAQEIIEAVPDSFALRLTRALANDTLLSHRIGLRRNDQDWQERIAARERLDDEFRASVVTECATNLKGGQLFSTIEGCIRDMDQAGFSSWPNHFLFELAKNHHDEAISFADSILASPDTPLARFFHVILGGVGSWSKEAVSSLIQKAHASGSPVIQQALAQHYWFSNRENVPTGADLEVLKALLRSDDAHASRLAIESLSFLAQRDADLAFQLAIEVPIQGQQSRAEGVCHAFERAYGISPDRLSDDQLIRLLGELDAIPDLEDHWIQQFLSFAAKRTPLAIVELFIRRIEHRADARDSDFRPIPFHVAVNFQSLAKHPEYPRTLRRIRDLTLQPSWHFAYFASDLFWTVAQDSTALEVLREWVESNQKEHVVAAAHILEKAGSNFVFGNPEFVSLILERAAAIDEECYRDAFVYLHSSATTGSKSGVVGQPMPRDVEIREKASFLVKRFAAQPKVKALYESLAKGAEMDIRQDRERFEEMFADD